MLLGWVGAKVLPLKKMYRSQEFNCFHSFVLNEDEQVVLQECNNHMLLEGVKLLRDINSMSEI